jgi:isocitrate dehydrogenase (NAD+)
MLDYLDFADTATRIRQAVRQVYVQGDHLTPDQGGKGTTSQFCAAIAARIENGE